MALGGESMKPQKQDYDHQRTNKQAGRGNRKNVIFVRMVHMILIQGTWFVKSLWIRMNISVIRWRMPNIVPILNGKMNITWYESKIELTCQWIQMIRWNLDRCSDNLPQGVNFLSIQYRRIREKYLLWETEPYLSSLVFYVRTIHKNGFKQTRTIKGKQGRSGGFGSGRFWKQGEKRNKRPYQKTTCIFV